MQSLDACEDTRTFDDERKEIIGITSDSEVATDKAKRVQTLTEKLKDISCAINDGEVHSNKFHDEQSFIDEKTGNSNEIKESKKPFGKAESEEILEDISDNSGATNYSQKSSQKEGYSRAVGRAEREMDTTNYCGNCPNKGPHLETLNENENKRFPPDEENERSDEENKDNNIHNLNKDRISFNDSTPMSRLHDDLPSLSCRPTVDNPSTYGMLVCDDLKENDQSLFLKVDESVRNDEQTKEANRYEENRTHCLSNSFELGNALDQASTCGMSVCEKLRENEQNQNSEMDENEEEIKRTNANGENIFDSLPHLSDSSDTFAQQNSTVISARDYLEENDPNLYCDTDEGEESDEETEETTDCLPNLLKSINAFARPSGGALPETIENDMETNANEENITYRLPSAVDSGTTIDQTTHSISVCEYLTKKDQIRFLEMNESEEYEDDIEEETEANADNFSAGFPNSIESSNAFSHQNKCEIPACAYRKEHDQNLYAEIGDSEENYEEMTQTNANEGNISDFFPNALDLGSGSIFAQKNSTVISASEYLEENDQHLCNNMDETGENDDENQERNTRVPDSLKPSNSCSDPMTETQQNDRGTNSENITDSLPNASCSTIDQSHTYAMSVCEYLNEEDQNLFLEMIESEETEATNSNEELFSDCVPHFFESSNTFAQENKHVSPVCKYLEESDQKLYSKVERSKESDEETGEESDEKTEEANLQEVNRTHCLCNSLEASNTIGQATVYAISVAEFLKENDQNLFFQADESNDNDEEMRETKSNRENILDFLPTSSDNTFAPKDSTPISACEYLEENDRNVYFDMSEREERTREEEHREINPHEENTTHCLSNLLKSINAFARQTTNEISETQRDDIETSAEDIIDSFLNASRSTVDQPATCAMSLCEYLSEDDQTLSSEILESKEDAEETEESIANQETHTDCLSRSSESGDTFTEQTKNRIPVYEYLEGKDQHLLVCFKMEESEENEEATEQANVNEEIRAYYLPNSLDLGNTLDQANTYDITVCEYLKEKEQNLYSETEESEDNDWEITETNARGENISDCFPISLESCKIPAQQLQSTALSAPEFLYTGESEEKDKAMYEATAKEENFTDCLPSSVELDKFFDQPTIDAKSEKNENDEQDSAKEERHSGSLSSSSELCDTFAKQNTNVISVSEYLEQNDQILFSETEESEGDEETNESMPDSSYRLLESCNNVAQHPTNSKSVFEYPEESDENLRSEMKKNEENDGQLNENKETRQMRKMDGKLLHLAETCIEELKPHDSCFSPVELFAFQECHQQITADYSTCDYLRQTDGTAYLNISELNENRYAEVGNDEDQGTQVCNASDVEIITYEDLSLLQKTQEHAETEMLVDNGNSAYELKHMKESSVKPEIPECLFDPADSVNAHSQHRTHTEQIILGFHPNEQNQVSRFDRETDNGAEGMEENWRTSKIIRNASSEHNIIMLPTSTNLQNESASVSQVDDEHENNGEEMYKVDEASKRVNYKYVHSLHKDNNLSLDNSSFKADMLSCKADQCSSRSSDCSNFNDQDTHVISKHKFLRQIDTADVSSHAEENDDFEEDFGIDEKKSKTSDDSGQTQHSKWVECSVAESQPPKYSLVRQSLNSGCVIRRHSSNISPVSGITEENDLHRISVIETESSEYEGEVCRGKDESQLANKISIEYKLPCKALQNVSRRQSLSEISNCTLSYQPIVTTVPVSTHFPQPPQETVSSVNRKSEKNDKAFSENGEESEIMDDEGYIEAPLHRHAMFEHSGSTVVDQTPSGLYDSSERIHHFAADASLTSVVDPQMTGDSGASVRIPCYHVMTVAEYLLESDPMNNSEDDDRDSDCGSNYETSTTQKENPEEKKSDRDYVEENKSLEGCQKEDVRVPGNSEAYETETDDKKTEDGRETSFLSKAEDDTDSDECESSNISTETSNDEEEISKSLQQHDTKNQPNSLVLKELPDKEYNRLSQSVCELFLVLAGLLLIVCISLYIITTLYRPQLCFSYVFGPPPT